MVIEPLVPAEVDLREYSGMMLDVVALRDSKFTATVKPEEFRAGVLLWCAAWHQQPAATLPDDDIELAKLAGYGYAVREWKRVKAGALYGWAKASDGRLHHRTAAKVANAAWDARLKHLYDKFADRLRKENKRRHGINVPALPMPSFEHWKSAGRPADFPLEDGSFPTDPPAPSAGIPAEIDKPSDGNPTEKGLKGSEGKGSEGKGSKFKSDVGVTPTIPGPVDNSKTGKVALEKPSNRRAKPEPKGTNGQDWNSPGWVAATADTLGIRRIEGQDDIDFRDKVFAEVQRRMTAQRGTA